MELLLTLTKESYFDRFKSLADGYIFGSMFSWRFPFTIEEMVAIRNRCIKYNLSAYVAIDSFIEEDQLSDLENYMRRLKTLNLDGIYFHDLSVLSVARRLDMEEKLIYDGNTLLTNSLDANFYLKKGLEGVVLSPELTMDEYKGIFDILDRKTDMIIFGHLRLSYSKRMFLSNYFNFIHTAYDYKNSDTLMIEEEKRYYRMPIIEDAFGTRIYSDYIFEVSEELPYLKDHLKRGIVDSSFIKEELIFDILNTYQHVTENNYAYFKRKLKDANPEVPFASAYLYQKTSKVKDEN